MQDSNSENPTPYSYWVVKNRFLAGEYPGYQKPGNTIRSFFSKFYALLATINRPNKGWHSVQVRCAELINSGVNSFVDLTEEGELPEYSSFITEMALQEGVTINYTRMPIRDRKVPTISYLKTILDYIDNEIDNNKNVYVHCFRGLGRTGTIVGTYLARHGKTGEEALAEIFNLRQGVLNSWWPSPQTEEQRKMVFNWKE